MSAVRRRRPEPVILVLAMAIAGAAAGCGADRRADDAPAAVADSHVHAGAAVPAPPPAAIPTRHATDAPLRAGMRGIHAAVAALEHGRHGHLDEVQVKRLAGQADAHIKDIFANCRLAPAADAELHEILVPLMEGTRAIQARPADLSALGPMQQALERYARRFDDPGFPEG